MAQLLEFVEKENVEAKNFKINFLDAINIVAKSWSKVKSTTIKKLLQKCWF